MERTEESKIDGLVIPEWKSTKLRYPNYLEIPAKAIELSIRVDDANEVMITPMRTVGQQVMARLKDEDSKERHFSLSSGGIVIVRFKTISRPSEISLKKPGEAGVIFKFKEMPDG